MSIVRCDCGRMIDSDYDVECFMDDDTIKCEVCRDDADAQALLDEQERNYNRDIGDSIRRVT